MRIAGGRIRFGANHRKGGGDIWDESGGDQDSGEVAEGSGRPECDQLLGGERTRGKWDGGGKKTGCDTTSGESGGKTRGENHRRETSQTQGGVESYNFMDVPLSRPGLPLPATSNQKSTILLIAH